MADADTSTKTEPLPEVDGPRPWHGTDSPFEAMYQHFTAEVEKLWEAVHTPAKPETDALHEHQARPDLALGEIPSVMVHPGVGSGMTAVEP